MPAPVDWKSATQQGKTYDLTSGIGRELWKQVQLRLSASSLPTVGAGLVREIPGPAYGEPTLVRPRLGQGTFRVVVTDNYDRRCAVTGERTVPVLEAAHVKPFRLVQEHDPCNGLLLRSDLHTLLDEGYVTVTRDFCLEVSRRLREDWENGRPDPAFLQWHRENKFRN